MPSVLAAVAKMSTGTLFPRELPKLTQDEEGPIFSVSSVMLLVFILLGFLGVVSVLIWLLQRRRRRQIEQIMPRPQTSTVSRTPVSWADPYMFPHARIKPEVRVAQPARVHTRSSRTYAGRSTLPVASHLGGDYLR
ncbi:hypothetical protein M422DRAFT_24826 [Sphaerobolus stellatus SS14]|nr:hypothetical protein M422DRAFT_24826 [Sphaerobolus stellatus SS14]